MRWCTKIDKYQVCCSKASLSCIVHAPQSGLTLWKSLSLERSKPDRRYHWLFLAQSFFSASASFFRRIAFFWRRWAFPGASPRAASSLADNFAFQSLQCDKKLMYEQALGWIFKQRNLDMFEDIKLRLTHFGTGWRDSMLILFSLLWHITQFDITSAILKNNTITSIFCRSN